MVRTPKSHASTDQLFTLLDGARGQVLAAVYQTSGGTYIYRRERLALWRGFAAG
ncbi:hypothetical protein [Saccharopolyspora phatthalungensis]|uniref:Uncharacterized protein n=1 Tax=Saccharopolyspora phatthalungensis TaxID=664693 RepID=A0A840QCD0_9PSEU|nr:hypothetical protein [Saccharopolyspora phatthalungensis]MBB5157491.1 hypothetical protein [Saccharopolyspora phatthalungensis]